MQAGFLTADHENIIRLRNRNNSGPRHHLGGGRAFGNEFAKSDDQCPCRCGLGHRQYKSGRGFERKPEGWRRPELGLERPEYKWWCDFEPAPIGRR